MSKITKANNERHNAIKRSQTKSIINAKEGLYTNSFRSLDGKRQNKLSCVYYNKKNDRCTNSRCSKYICGNAGKCSCFKRKTH